MTGDELHELRKAAGLTQQEFADRMGLGLRAYNEAERHKGEPIRVLHAVAAERVALRIAAEKHDLMLAPATVRADVVSLVDAVVGRTTN
jgi:transcriptional regulator with XRE-family HTH domain